MPAAATELFTRAATFAPSSFNAERRSVQVVWSTGAPVLRHDFEGPFTERLSLDPDAVDLSELRGAPVLNSHDHFDVRSILGVVEKPAVDGQQGVATIRFSERADAGIIADVGAGIISRVSTGYRVSRWETSKDAAGNRTKTAVRWTPAEISFTALAADRGAHTRSASMPEVSVPDQIRSAAALLGINGPFVEGLIAREGVTIENARGELLTHLHQQQPRIDGRATITRDEHEDFAARAANALAHRKVFGITRQALVNDDLGVFSDIASQLSTQAAEFENEQLAALLVANPVMSDGNTLFSVAHANLAVPGTAINDVSLSAARLALRLTKNQNGQPISVTPRYLLASATKETEAEKALAAIYPATTDTANVFEDFVQLVVDPRLDNLAQTLPWYLFGDPTSVPCLEYSYLSGAEGPQVETRTGFSGGSDVDGTEVLCKLDYGCGVIASVGAYKNPGA